MAEIVNASPLIVLTKLREGHERRTTKRRKGLTKIIHGKIHGKTIELDEDLGVADGEAVEVQVKVVPQARPWGEGILRSAGGWADHPEMDAIMQQIHQDRKLERRPQMEE